MTIRTRLTLWYAGILFGSLLLMGGVLHYELVGEYERGRPPESPSEKITDIVLFYGVPTGIAVVLGGAWLIRRSLRPVETLVASAERVHAGNLAERIPLTGRGDELDRLASVFNVMLARVEAGVASVRDFTLHASHELKTPLTILSAESELALNEPSISAAERVRLTSQIEEIRRLAILVDALSFLAKVDAGVPVIARESLRLDEVLRVAVENARALGAARGVTIELVRCDAAPIDADRAGIRQVLLNLLENAVKHNRANGWVRVELLADTEGATLSVENSGIPIPPELLPSIFDRFVRGPGTVEGSGLGLSIAKTLIEAHGGAMTYVDRAADSVLFVVRLPRNISVSADEANAPQLV
ncbi:MAG: ATP-binding protein [Opitutus sp.]